MLFQSLPASVKIGSVPYLNARPLVYGLTPPPLLLPPASLSQKLRNQELDVALIPLIECLQNPSYLLIDDIAIGCRGPVQSVLAVGIDRLSSIRQITPDPASLSSNQLLRVLLHLDGNSQAVFSSIAAPDLPKILIGDPALDCYRNSPETPKIDLGSEWFRLTGLPFVFAVWAIHPDTSVHPPTLANQLRSIKKIGLQSIDQITDDPFEQTYLRQILRYDLGPEEKQGIHRFAQLLVSLKVLADVPSLNWI